MSLPDRLAEYGRLYDNLMFILQISCSSMLCACNHLKPIDLLTLVACSIFGFCYISSMVKQSRSKLIAWFNEYEAARLAWSEEQCAIRTGLAIALVMCLCTLSSPFSSILMFIIAIYMCYKDMNPNYLVRTPRLLDQLEILQT